MSSNMPFQPCIGTTTGKTVKVIANNTPSSVSGTLDTTGLLAETLLVTNNGTVIVFARMSAELPPTATAADVPIPAGSGRVFANPNPGGKVGLAVISSTTTSCDVYFTPGAGGHVQ